MAQTQFAILTWNGIGKICRETELCSREFNLFK